MRRASWAGAMAREGFHAAQPQSASTEQALGLVPAPSPYGSWRAAGGFLCGPARKGRACPSTARRTSASSRVLRPLVVSLLEQLPGPFGSGPPPRGLRRRRSRGRPPRGCSAGWRPSPWRRGRDGPALRGRRPSSARCRSARACHCRTGRGGERGLDQLGDDVVANPAHAPRFDQQRLRSRRRGARAAAGDSSATDQGRRVAHSLSRTAAHGAGRGVGAGGRRRAMTRAARSSSRRLGRHSANSSGCPPVRLQIFERVAGRPRDRQR